MDETISEQKGSKQPSRLKKVIMILVAALVLAGGSVAAFVFIDNKSDKETYFLTEKNSLENMKEQMENRYEQEIKWLEHTEENPIEDVLEITAEFNDPSGAASGFMSPEQIINNSSITLTNETDLENTQMSTTIVADIAGFEIGGLEAYLTAEEIMVGLPFLEEILQLRGDDVGNLLVQLDPTVFTGDETIDLEKIIEGNPLPEEDIEYLKEEYLKPIYEELPEEAFEATEETVQINGNDVKTEKITFHLNEEELQDILSNLFEQLSKDERIKDIMRDQYEFQMYGGFSAPQASDILMEEMEVFIEDYTEVMEIASEEVYNFKFPEGVTSTIWVNDDLVVKRLFELELGPNAEELVGLVIDGTHQWSDDNHQFDYTFGLTDSVSSETVEAVVTGDLTFENDKIHDTITLGAEGFHITYEANETLTTNGKEFERTIAINENSNELGKLLWSGDATYDNDQMQSNHELSVDSPELPQDIITLHLAKESKTINQVEIPSGDSVKDLGSMDIEELMMYFETEVAPQFEEWLNGLMGPGF